MQTEAELNPSCAECGESLGAEPYDTVVKLGDKIYHAACVGLKEIDVCGKPRCLATCCPPWAKVENGTIDPKHIHQCKLDRGHLHNDFLHVFDCHTGGGQVNWGPEPCKSCGGKSWTQLDGKWMPCQRCYPESRVEAEKRDEYHCALCRASVAVDAGLQMIDHVCPRYDSSVCGAIMQKIPGDPASEVICDKPKGHWRSEKSITYGNVEVDEADFKPENVTLHLTEAYYKRKLEEARVQGERAGIERAAQRIMAVRAELGIGVDAAHFAREVRALSDKPTTDPLDVIPQVKAWRALSVQQRQKILDKAHLRTGPEESSVLHDLLRLFEPKERT